MEWPTKEIPSIGAGQHRHVGVVPAGVHPVRVARRERQPGLLGHRQRVHVGA